MHRFEVSERRACKVVGQHRSTQRYELQPVDFEDRVLRRMNKLAEEHPRWGYRMVCAVMRQEGFGVNPKRIYRLWVLEGNKVPPARRGKGKKASGSPAGAQWNSPAIAVNDVWAYDFIERKTATGATFRTLNVIDEFTRRGLGSLVGRSIGARDVEGHLGRLFSKHGPPRRVRSDNGREFTAEPLLAFLAAKKVAPVFIDAGCPWQNPICERYNGSMANELLDVEVFHNATEAQVMVDGWNREYNTLRPHRSLRMKTPQAFYEASRVVSE